MDDGPDTGYAGERQEKREDADLREYFDTFEMVLEEARRMLLDEALDENPARPHHLASAVTSLQDAVKLDEVRQIVHDLYLGEGS